MPKKKPARTRTAKGVRRPAARVALGSSPWSPRSEGPWGPQSSMAKPVMPPAKLAPIEQPPVGVSPKYGQLAPWPLIDRYPVVIGQNLTLSYIASVFRLATTGYRQQYVDLLDELLEQDPHLYSVVQKRILSVANGRLEIVPADLPEGDPREDRAEALAAWVGQEVARIPELVQQLAGLLWGGIYYGVGNSEIHWSRTGDGWRVDRLSFIHSRRLAYPDPQAWDLYIWDQGQVYGWQTPWGASPTNNSMFGLRVADYPGKFITHAPSLRGDYPTRDGVGRQTATWAALKRISGRGASEYLERFAKPWVDVSFTTGADGKPREANNEEIAEAQNAAGTQGVGSLSSYVHPDTIKLDAKAADAGRPKITYTDWMAVCNAEESKAVLGGTLGTEVGKGGGNRSLGEVQERGELDLEAYDAQCLGDTLDRDLIQWLVRLNFPEDIDIAPHAKIHVAKDPDPKTVLDNVWIATQAGMPVDADWAAQESGLRLVNKDNEDGPARRTYKSDVADPTAVDPDLMSAEAKQQQADQAKQQLDIQKAKASAPTIMPGQVGGAPRPPLAVVPKPGGSSAAPKQADDDTTQPAAPDNQTAVTGTERGGGQPAGTFRPGTPTRSRKAFY